jgi:cell division protein ZapA
MSAKGTRSAGSAESMVTLDVSLLGRDYKVACKPDEQSELKDAVAFLELRMRDIRDGSKTSSVERVAVMAALNLAHDFQLQRGRAAPAALATREAPDDALDLAAVRQRIAGMQSAIDQVLASKDKLF